MCPCLCHHQLPTQAVALARAHHSLLRPNDLDRNHPGRVRGVRRITCPPHHRTRHLGRQWRPSARRRNPMARCGTTTMCVCVRARRRRRPPQAIKPPPNHVPSPTAATRACVRAHARTHTHTHACARAHTHGRARARAHTHAQAHMCVSARAHTHSHNISLTHTFVRAEGMRATARRPTHQLPRIA